MEYIPGEHLLSAQQKNLKEKKANRYMKEIVEGIAHCHAQNVIHRSIKSENIFVNKQDKIKMLGF